MQLYKVNTIYNIIFKFDIDKNFALRDNIFDKNKLKKHKSNDLRRRRVCLTYLIKLP